ncbi:universal stress protein [Natronomonas gomsonensis]|uniref:universal stress protein n=1 Tax=Natronomonas gomsonensis TaxID=1046043 RepID=UPI0015B960AB|nr:universal stress protein [Natronomonas gomsonensis]
MHTVLLPVDESIDRAKRVVDVVKSLPGDESEVQAVVLNVSESVKQPWLQEFETLERSELDDAEVPESVITAIELLTEYGVDTEMRLEEGDVTDQIITVANDVSADQIVMCGRKKSATGKLLFGSIAQSVLLNAQRPVTILVSD